MVVSLGVGKSTSHGLITEGLCQRTTSNSWSTEYRLRITTEPMSIATCPLTRHDCEDATATRCGLSLIELNRTLVSVEYGNGPVSSKLSVVDGGTRGHLVVRIFELSYIILQKV